MEERRGPPNARHNPARLRLLRWILKDPRDYYFFPFLLVFILLLLFQRRCERSRTSDNAYIHQLAATRVHLCYLWCTHVRFYTTRERGKEEARKGRVERKSEKA